MEVKGIKVGTVITDIKSASFQTVILTGDKTLFKIEHPQVNNPEIVPEMQMPFTTLPIKKLTNIVKISACYGHMLALERADTEPLSKWGPEKVSTWFHSIGLGDCCNVIKY